MDVTTVCLGVLTLGDATGYEIRYMFEDGPFRYFTDAGFGSIYRALNRLRREGLVTRACRP
jgi:DNA-binding PadR family transcriptional regulator